MTVVGPVHKVRVHAVDKNCSALNRRQPHNYSPNPRSSEMLNPRNAIYIFVATCSLAIAACQPHEGPAERAGKNIDNAAKKVGDQVDKAADKTKEAVKDATK
jgi:predicted small secreted protein